MANVKDDESEYIGDDEDELAREHERACAEQNGDCACEMRPLVGPAGSAHGAPDWRED